ncbi:MAG: hypothetical protein A2X66_07425 [Ignavibacteria bacterium GWA2_54_16]|nr:MAG: hypothetical protein A2X66_07425 [Ignavibacteria bacterium GWA2_54_16]
MKPKITIRLLFVFLLSGLASATLLGQETEYEKWLKKEQEKFQQFKDERDKEFTEFLKREWKEMQAMHGIVPDTTPKPLQVPIYKPHPQVPKDTVSKPVIIKEPPAPKPEKAPPEQIPSPCPQASRDTASKPVIIKEAPAPKREEAPPAIIPPPRPQVTKDAESKPVIIKETPIPQRVEPPPLIAPAPVPLNPRHLTPLDVPFFNTTLSLERDDSLRMKLSGTIDKDAISDCWAALSRSNYEELLAQLQRKRNEMKLNDWGFALLLNQVGRKVFGAPNEARLFVWFMLAKSGYDAKIGYSTNQLHLLLPTTNRLFYVPYLTFDNDQRKFYVAALNPGEKPYDGHLFSYEGKYPGAEKNTDYVVKSAPTLNHVILERKLKFEYGGKEYSFNVKLSRDAVDFFREYPLMNFEVYFGSASSPEAAQTLLSQWKPVVQGKTEREAVNMLLRFVQTAFDYKTDPEQFGREKPLFPDETLFYPYCDCEDRSILFAYLVKNLFGLDVVALDYPGHIATAVKFGSAISGDSVQFRGATYTICDPTYINADIGMCMPQFKEIVPNVIVISN